MMSASVQIRTPLWISGVGYGILGFEKYEAVLRSSAIDDAVLPKLTEDHLRELEHVPPELNSVGFPGRSGWQILSALIRFWERERCRRPTLLIFEVE